MQTDYEGLLTVDRSNELLANNHTNRPVKPHVVKRYTRQIKKDRWTGTPVPIIYTNTGRLVDGQHRCLGVIGANKPINVKFSVIPDERYEEVYRVLDIGATRTLDDALREDKNVIKPIAFLLRAALTVQTPETDDVEPFLNGDLGDILRRLVNIKSEAGLWRKTPFRAAVASAILAEKIDEGKAISLVTTLSTQPINEWPPLFAKLYMQLTNKETKLNGSGRSLENDTFMRSYYALTNFESGITTIRCYASFRRDMKFDVYTALYQKSPEIFD